MADVRSAKSRRARERFIEKRRTHGRKEEKKEVEIKPKTVRSSAVEHIRLDFGTKKYIPVRLALNSEDSKVYCKDLVVTSAYFEKCPFCKGVLAENACSETCAQTDAMANKIAEIFGSQVILSFDGARFVIDKAGIKLQR